MANAFEERVVSVADAGLGDDSISVTSDYVITGAPQGLLFTALAVTIAPTDTPLGIRQKKTDVLAAYLTGQGLTFVRTRFVLIGYDRGTLT